MYKYLHTKEMGLLPITKLEKLKLHIVINVYTFYSEIVNTWLAKIAIKYISIYYFYVNLSAIICIKEFIIIIIQSIIP